VTSFDVVGVGANAIDFVYTLPAYPRPEGPLSKLRIIGTERSPGGQTATVLCACASLGLRTRYVGTISTDDNGLFVRDAMRRRGVDLSLAIEREAPNAYAVILLEERSVAGPSGADAVPDPFCGERIVLWDRDPRMVLKPRDLPPDFAAGARLVHLDDVDGDAAATAGRAAMRAGLPVTSDLEAVKPHTAALLDAVTIPIFAEQVPRELTGKSDLESSLRRLRMPHMTLMCVTLGPDGAVLLAGDRFIRQPAFRIDAVDTTGAGDVFRAGFIYALLRGDSPETILRFACAAAAVSCTRRGAINSVPLLEDVNALLNP
jgi:sugar/nucleoside kinase (ribokinase family)